MQRRHGQGRVDGYKLNYCAYAMLHAVVYTHLTHTHMHTHSNNKRQTTCGPLTANSNYIYTPFPLFPFPLPLSQPLLPSCNPSHLHRLPFPLSRLTFRSPQSRNDRFIICLIAWLAASSFKTLCQRTANSRKQTAEIRLINNLFNYQPVY